jgi:hypothetical protein
VTLAADLSVRQAQRDQLEAWLKARPMRTVYPDELRAVVGPNYRSRISDCRKQLGMVIQNVPQFFTNEHGEKQRGEGAYVFVPRPKEPLGPDAGSIRSWTLFDLSPRA